MEKKTKLSFVKSIDVEKRLVSGYVSTYEYDRDEERFVKGAWDLKAYKENPVVLWGHDHRLPPIGKSVDLIEDDNGLFSVSEFAKTDLAQQVLSLFEGGFLNAFSVGFIRKNFMIEDRGEGQKGLAITEAELYEYSAVSVPANPGALVSREVAEIAMKTIGPNVIEVVKSTALGDQFLVLPTATKPKTIDELEPVLAQVIELARATKGEKVNDKRRELITTAMTLFTEILAEPKKDLSGEELGQLKGLMVELAGLAAAVHPQSAESINKTISQIEKAVSGRAA